VRELIEFIRGSKRGICFGPNTSPQGPQRGAEEDSA
jgi:hypothetical protein